MRADQWAVTTLASCAILLAGQALAESLDDVSLGRELLLDNAAVSLAELDESRGRQDIQLDIDEIQASFQQNQGEQTAQLKDNLLNSNLTGNNYIGGQALNGVNGIATVIQNTGNQVIIQDTTMVNIMMQP